MGRFDQLTQLGQPLTAKSSAAQPLDRPSLVRPVVSVPPSGDTPVPPGRRKIKQRHPFDIYEDQYEALKALAQTERVDGHPGGMSAMVRAGIDLYLASRKQRP